MATSNRTAISKAVQTATNPALLTKIARTSERIDDLGFRPNKSGVDTITLAAKILDNREMAKIVDWFKGSDLQAEEIAVVLGTIIAASRIAARA